MPSRRRVAVLLALAFTAFYAATTRGVLAFGDDVLYFQVTEAMVERGQVGVSSRSPGRVPGRPIVGPDGRRYAKYGLGFSLAAIPAYLVGREFERLGADLEVTTDPWGRVWAGTKVFAVGLTNAVVGGVAVAATFYLALELGFGLAVAAGLAAALGGATYFAHYSTNFLSEPLSAALLAVAVAAALRAVAKAGAVEARAAWVALSISGSAGGFALLTRVAHLAAVAPIGLWLLVALLRPGSAVSRRRAIGLCAAWGGLCLLGIAGVAIYNDTRFGTPFETGYGGEARQFTTPILEGLAGLVVSPAKGALWYAPPLLLAVPGWICFLRRKPAAAALLGGVCASSGAVFAAYYQWWGGGTWGPRFLIAVLPLALIPAAEILTLASARNALARIGAVVCLAAGGLVVCLALLVPFERHLPTLSRHERRPQNRGRVEGFWRISESPLVRHARELPIAARRSLRFLTGSEGLPGPRDRNEPGLPDLAFVRYGSHALLQWTRAWLLVAAVAGAAAVRTVRRHQKASLSRPPQ